MGSGKPTVNSNATTNQQKPSINPTSENVERGRSLVVEGHIADCSVEYLVDTGTTDTIISVQMYNSIPVDSRPTLFPMKDSAQQADGSPLKSIGWASMNVRIGPTSMYTPVVVAEITNDAMLGMDFMYMSKCTIDPYKEQLRFGDKVVQCNVKTSSTRTFCAKVTLRQNITIPPGHEMLIPGKINRTPGIEGLGILEPGSSKLKEAGAVVARVVVDLDTTKPDYIPVRVFNPTLSNLTVKKNTAIGTVSPVVGWETVNGKIDQEINKRKSEKNVPEHLQTLYEASVQELPQEYHAGVADLLTEYQDVFSTGDDDLGRTGIVKHRINTGNAPPIRQKPRRLAPAMQAEADKHVKDMLKRGIIEPSESPWASPIVLVTKKDGSRRFCSDYRLLNEVTVKDSYPIPRIEETLESLSGAQWFSTLDLASGYWQVELDQEAKEKSAFVVRGGLYQWTVMPFGLCNAPSTFERLMENIMAGLQWESLLIYLDDVIVFGKTIEEELNRLKRVFQKLRQANLKLKPKKCVLFQKSVLYLGHVVSREGIATDPEKIRVIQEWETPKCLKDVRAFLGLASYYRRYVKSFCDIARPLNRLTQKNIAFNWTNSCEEAFLALKQCLTTSPVLAYPTYSGQFTLDTDASAYGIGAVLSQEQNGQEKVIAYASRTLTRAQRNYCVTRRELLAVVFFVRYFRPYLYGRHFTIRTDHGSLRWLINFRNPEGQVARWLQILGEYDYEIVHRAGKSHQNADSLSRKPCSQCNRSDSESKTTTATEEDPEPKRDLIMSNKSCQFPEQNSTPNSGEGQQQEGNHHPEQNSTPNSGEGQQEGNHHPEQYADHDSTKTSNGSHFGASPKRVPKKQTSSEAAPTNISVRTDQLSATERSVSASCNDSDQLASTAVPNTPEHGTASVCGNTSGTVELTDSQVNQTSKVRAICPAPKWTNEEMKNAQMNDSDLAWLWTAKELNKKPEYRVVSPLSKAAKAYYLEWDRIELKEGKLYRRWESNDGNVIKWQLIMPEKYKECVLEELHNSKTAAHLGVTKTRNKLNERFYWFGLSSDIRSWLRKCDICAKRKSPSTRRKAKLQQDIAGHPGQRIAMDILGPLPVTPTGNRYILVVGDYYSKWVEAYPIPDQEAVTCANKLTHEWICRQGCPTILHSDQGRNFESKVMAEVCSLLGIDKTRTTPLNPKSDGFIERFNRTMLNMVSVLLDPQHHQQDWEEVLPYAMMAYRSSIQESTGETPFLMMYGEEMMLPVDLFGMPSDSSQDAELSTDYAQKTRHRLREAHDRAREVLKQAAKRQKRNYDKGIITQPIQVGSFVWLHQEIRKKGRCPKLQFKWDGPYLIVSKLSDVVYRIQKSQQSKPKVVHYDRLKPYEGEELHNWLTK